MRPGARRCSNRAAAALMRARSAAAVDDAFGRLLDLMAGVFGADRDPIRTRILDYFEIIGVDDERVAAARRRLASLLY